LPILDFGFKKAHAVKRGAAAISVSLSILAVPLAVGAQPPAKIPRIGVLAAGIPTTYISRYEAFRQGLRDLGYVEGQTIAIEYRYAEGNFERLPDLAAELVGLKVDLIVASSAPETGAAKRATTSIPIVFAAHGDPVGTGHVASLAKPGGNLTGMSTMEGDLSPKRLQLLKETFPRIARVAVLWNAANPAKGLDWRETQRAARTLGLTLQSREVRRPDDFASAFAAMTKQRPDALLTLSDPLLLNSRTSIVAFAAKERLPAMYGQRAYMDAGGLMAYGPILADSYRRAATHVDKILKGAKPADLPVEQPTTFELVINLKTAKALGLTIPQSILLRADEVIE
jgi:putative ABC transport system substrate-binding protein